MIFCLVLKDLYNNQLIKDFGNLYQRLFTLAKPIQSELNLWFEQNLKIVNELDDYHIQLVKEITSTYALDKYKKLFLTMCASANKELTDKKPWEKSIEIETRICIIANLVIQLKQIMDLLYPIISNKIDELRKWFGLTSDINGFKINITVDKIKAFVPI